MEVVKHNIRVIPDNEANYFTLLEAVVASIDPYSSLAITRSPNSYTFRLSPSEPLYINPLVEQLILLHNHFGIHLDFSKSIKTSCTISFAITVK